MFAVGDRVRLAKAFRMDVREPVGTVVGFLKPRFAAVTGAPDDVLVRWDTGLELPHAPASLAYAVPLTDSCAAAVPPSDPNGGSPRPGTGFVP
jgi:hypothetical protein